MDTTVLTLFLIPKHTHAHIYMYFSTFFAVPLNLFFFSVAGCSLHHCVFPFAIFVVVVLSLSLRVGCVVMLLVGTSVEDAPLHSFCLHSLLFFFNFRVS